MKSFLKSFFAFFILELIVLGLYYTNPYFLDFWYNSLYSAINIPPLIIWVLSVFVSVVLLLFVWHRLYPRKTLSYKIVVGFCSIALAHYLVGFIPQIFYLGMLMTGALSFTSIDELIISIIYIFDFIVVQQVSLFMPLLITGVSAWIVKIRSVSSA